MKHNKALEIRLDLFDGGAAAGGAAGAGAAASGGQAGDGTQSGGTQASSGVAGRGSSNSDNPAARGRRGAGEYNNVLFGKQPAATADGTGTVTEPQTQPSDAGSGNNQDGKTTSNTLEDRRKAFRDLVNGEYKDVYAEETQRIIDRRFRETKTLQDTVNRNQPVIDMLMQRYKIADGDIGKLTRAIESDNAYWSEAAEEAGMSVEQYKEFQRLQRENEQLVRMQRAQMGQQRANQQLQQWYGEAQQLKAKFPGFNLDAEVQNPQFVSMLKAGIPVEHAYKVLHMDEIVNDAMRTSAADTEKRVVDNVRAKGTRPQENGTAAQSAFTIKDDVSKLTRKDRAEIARRAARGDTITF